MMQGFPKSQRGTEIRQGRQWGPVTSQQDRREMVKDRARDFEAKRQPKRETASERGAMQPRKDRQWGDEIRGGKSHRRWAQGQQGSSVHLANAGPGPPVC